ncbi:MAG: serine--tRNA ligase [Desulfobulbaceae bacterium A2]|nr:MAG: serine--tRNA ligase [Desulfobulbaceae bacterium A2]
MLELRYLREHLDLVREKTARRGAAPELLDNLVAVDQRRLDLLAEAEALKGQRNTVSREIARRKQEGDQAGSDTLIGEMRGVSDRIKALDETLGQVQGELEALVLTIPNLVHDSVPRGRDEKDNVELRRWGQLPQFSFTPRPHWEVGERLGILDFERAAKLSGARFAVLSGLASKLERALINFMLDLHTQRHGYTEVLPPFLVNSQTMTGTGQLPKFAADLFRIQDWDLWLIPTAEVPVTNLHAGETLADNQLPLKYAAYTPCFRSEAGSYGKDTRGLIRQHQFDKVELVKFVAPERSDEELESLLADAEEVLQLLELPYRVIALCTGDLGFSACKTYDIEVWLPSQNTYREISSCSNFLDFQARRAGIRSRGAGGGKSRLVHTLNGSGLAVGRTLAAILENRQREDGSIELPEVLEPYFAKRF